MDSSICQAVDGIGSSALLVLSLLVRRLVAAAMSALQYCKDLVRRADYNNYLIGLVAFNFVLIALLIYSFSNMKTR